MNAIKLWAYDVAVRAVKTAAQALAGLLAVNAVDVLHIDWRADLLVAGGAAVACVLQNVQSFPMPVVAAPVADVPPVKVAPVVVAEVTAVVPPVG